MIVLAPNALQYLV